MNGKRCPFCGSLASVCPECGKVVPIGTLGACTTPTCVELNAPMDCARCGRVVSEDCEGVLEFTQTFRPFREIDS